MSHEDQVRLMTDKMASFVGHVAKVLPDDVQEKIAQMAAAETEPLAKSIYETMHRNMQLAEKLDRPSCQDTGVLQYWVKCGTGFPLMGDLEALLKEATVQATFATPLRHNSVETFDEANTKRNVGKGTPTVFWDIVPNWDGCEIYTYMAGGGCTLPGHAMVLMPGDGYEGVAKFVLDRMTSYGLNACPPIAGGRGCGHQCGDCRIAVQKGADAPHRLAQRQRTRRKDGETARGRYQQDWSRTAGSWRGAFGYGCEHREHRKASVRYRRSR